MSKREFWRVEECKSNPGLFIVAGEVDGKTVTTGRMSFSEAFRIARKANIDSLLHTRPMLRVSKSEAEAIMVSLKGAGDEG